MKTHIRPLVGGTVSGSALLVFLGRWIVGGWSEARKFAPKRALQARRLATPCATGAEFRERVDLESPEPLEPVPGGPMSERNSCRLSCLTLGRSRATPRSGNLDLGALPDANCAQRLSGTFQDVLTDVARPSCTADVSTAELLISRSRGPRGRHAHSWFVSTRRFSTAHALHAPRRIVCESGTIR